MLDHLTLPNSYHTICCCLFSVFCLFVFFSLSHFAFQFGWFLLSYLQGLFSLPCQVCQSIKNNSSSLTMSSYSCHLHFTYESIYFYFYDKIHIYLHTLFFFSTWKENVHFYTFTRVISLSLSETSETS